MICYESTKFKIMNAKGFLIWNGLVFLNSSIAPAGDIIMAADQLGDGPSVNLDHQVL